MGKIRRPAKGPLEAGGVKDAAQGVAVGKMWRPRRPVKAVGVKDATGVAVIAVDGEVEASALGAPVVVAVGVKDAEWVAAGKMWRPRQPAKAPLEALEVKDAKGVAVITVDAKVQASVLQASVVVADRVKDAEGVTSGKMWRPRQSAKATLKALGVKDTEGVAAGKMWQPRQSAKVPLEVVGVKETQGAAVTIDGKVEASLLGAPVVGGGEKGPLEEGIAVFHMDALDGAPITTQHEAVGVKDSEGVAVRKIWRPRQPAKASLESLGVKDAKGIAVVTVDKKVEASVLGSSVVVAAGGSEKGTLEEAIMVCQMDALDEAPVVAMTQHEALGVKDTEEVAVRKMWRPRRPAKAQLEAAGVKDAEGVAVIAVHRVVKPVLGVSVVAAAGGGEMGPLEDGSAVCLMDSLDGTPVMTMTQHEAVGVKDAKGVAVGKMWQSRRPAKAPMEPVGLKDAQGVAVITIDGKVEASLLGAPVVAVAGGGEKRPLEEGIAVCQMDALDGSTVTRRPEAVGVKYAEGVAVGKLWRPRQPAKAPLEALGGKGVAVITVDGKVEASLLGAPVVAVAGGGEKRPLEEGIAVCQMDALDGSTVTRRPEAVGVKYAEGVAVGKLWRPRQPAKAPLEALGGKDVEGVAVITVDGKVEASVLGAPVVMATGGGEKVPLEKEIMVCQVDILDGDSVIAMTQKEVLRVKDTEEVVVGKMWRPRCPTKAPLEVAGVKDVEGVVVIAVNGVVKPLVLGVPVVAATGGGEKGSMEDGIVVSKMDALDGAPVIAIDEKEEVLVQQGPVFLAVDQKVDVTVAKGVKTITVKGGGKEEKDKEGIKWLKHYSTAQSILIVGDGDFSFSLALATTFGSGGNLVATSLDSYEALTIKYGKAESNVRELKRLGATVLHGVDAKKMKIHSYVETRQFDRIVFNFPHAGFNGRENWLRVIKAHKQLVHGFLANARQLLRPYGEIHLSHKTGLPYDAWDIEQLAYESCLIMVRKVDFSKEDYPGYNQKKGAGVTCDESFPLGPCCTFMFCVEDVAKLKQAHGNRVGSMSYLGDNKFYPGISATDMMWSFDPHPAWPQPHFHPVHLPIAASDPCPFGVAEMEHPFNCYGTSFHHQDMGRPTHQEQPWYQVGPPPMEEQPWTPQVHQSLQRECEIHRQLTLSLEDRYMLESIERQAMFQMLIQVYGGQWN